MTQSDSRPAVTRAAPEATAAAGAPTDPGQNATPPRGHNQAPPGTAGTALDATAARRQKPTLARRHHLTQAAGGVLPSGGESDSPGAWGDRPDHEDEALLREVPPHWS